MSPNMSPAGRRPPKGYAYEEVEEEIQTLLGQSPGPALPATPVSHSCNYGAYFGSVLPRRMIMPPTSDITLATKRIDATMEIARRRENDMSYGQKQLFQPQTKPRQRGQPSNLTPAPRRTKREPTPDQTQLLHNLRDATVSPTRDEIQPSDSTPSPPVQRAVSTDSSSPAAPPTQRRLSMTSNTPLYPSPLRRPGSHDVQFGSTPSRFSSVDNASEVSWNLERDIHEDDLQRTRPSKYRGEPHGRNITAPPRRPSGRAHLIQETIEEEEEDPVPRDSPATWTAPARTIIPQTFRSDTEISSPHSRSSKRGLISDMLSSTRPARRSPGKVRPQWIRAAGVLLISLLLAFAFQLDILAKFRSFIPSKDRIGPLPPNITEAEALNTLTSQIAEMQKQMSSMSTEIGHPHETSPTGPVDHVSVSSPEEHKVNFLCPANGAIVDPRLTTASAGLEISYWKRVILSVLGVNYRTKNPPLAALEPGHEPGDCWCTSTRGGQSQLSVLLDHDIVPEEVVVEHIPSGQTLDPWAAPREIELWARYRVVWDQTTDYTSPPATSNPPKPLVSAKQSRPADPPSARKETLGHLQMAPHISLHDIIMDTLRTANSHEPPSAYSDDPILGPSFYRISKMRYNIHQSSDQRFEIDTIINIPTIRVDKVVLRVKSNWGSNNTCIYRFKLHGHL